MQEPKVNIEEIQQKLVDKLKLSGWGVKLQGFILSSDFTSIIETLVKESTLNTKFTPPLKHLFRAFEECNYKDLKVIFVGQDPYPQVGVADGISFSCSLTGTLQPSLRHLFNGLEEDLKLQEIYKRDPDLKRWSNQGILMLNTALTCQINNPGSHIKLWDPFIKYLFDILNTHNSGLVFVFLGKKARSYIDLIGDNHFKIIANHPASAAHNGGVWNHSKIFSTIDTILWANYKTKINW